MRHSRVPLLGVGLLCFWLPLGASAADSIGQVIAITGQVAATGEDGKVRNLDLKSEIYLNDKVVTAKGAKIQIMFSDESIVSEGEGSELVIDQYVYNPKADKDGNCSLKLAKGVFRVITGKITDLNPDRFKVRTRMATIGIRGCELGFRLHKDREDILVLHLPKGKTIVIARTGTDAMGNLREQLDRILNIVDPGTAVTLEPGSELKERQIRPFEVKKIVEESTPTPLSADRDRDSDTGDQGVGGGDLLELSALRERLDQNATVASQAASSQAANQSLDNYYKTPPPLPSGPTSAPQASLPPADDRGPAILVGGHPELSHWEWGIWEDGYIEYHGNRYLGDTFLSDADYQNIVNGTQIYNLVDDGAGQCAAVVHYGGAVRVLDTGFCTLQVQVGTAAAPSWGGSFSMNNFDGDQLDFSVSGGSVGTGGRLSGGLDTYSMSLVGVATVFDLPSITSQSINGQLIRPATLPTPPACPINAAAGEFHFSHGALATVDGAFGANLQ